MWNQAAKKHAEAGENKDDKHHVESQGDSGFLSGSNLISSELSIDLENEERTDKPQVALEPVRAVDSGLDLGLTNSLSQLSLKAGSLNPLDSGTIHPEIEEFDSENIKDEAQEPWEIYYTQNDDGDTLLHISIMQGFLEAAFFIISTAAHPCLLNILNDQAQSPLHLAVLTHQPRIVRRLILAGADPTVRNFVGNMPLHLACATGDLYCAKALTSPITPLERTWLEPGKKAPLLPQNLEQRNYDGEMYIHIASSKGHADVVRHLLCLGADVDAREGLGGRTALHLAIEHRHYEVVRLLVQESRPQLEVRTYAGFTAYHLARCVDHQLAKELERLGATPSMPPGIDSDSESDTDEDEEKEYRLVLARYGVTSQAVAALATA